MSAARRGPGAKRSSTNSKCGPRPVPAACRWRTAAVVSAPWPRSVGVKLPWPKFGKTARPTMRSRSRCPLTVTVTVCPTVAADLAERGGAEHDLAGRCGAGGRRAASATAAGPGPRPARSPERRGRRSRRCPWFPNRPAGQGRAARPSQLLRPRGVIVRNCKSIAASQLCPYRRGVRTRCTRFAPKVNAAATASTDSAVPARALRTGMAVRPRPGSSARRTPVTAVTGAPAPASHPPPVAGGSPARPACRPRGAPMPAARLAMPPAPPAAP